MCTRVPLGFHTTYTRELRFHGVVKTGCRGEFRKIDLADLISYVLTMGTIRPGKDLALLRVVPNPSLPKNFIFLANISCIG